MQEIIKSKKRAGVSFPLISLWNETSYGCGDIYSLHSLMDWASDSGLSIVQILPLNDLGWGRSPYSSISAFAIDPIYISLHLLGIDKKKPDLSPADIKHRVIKKEKLEILQSHFDSIRDTALEQKLDSFLKSNKWLESYIPFAILYYDHDAGHWSTWKEEFSQNTLNKIFKERRDECYFHLYLQYIGLEQMKTVRELMEKKGIYIKGDMPILTSDNSADVWGRRNLFNRKLTSGAPPDYFNADGQNWGFPVIDWDEMKKENYSWWKGRLAYLENIYHLYRIDHVLGMYRIWAIPKEKTKASFGYFHPQKGVTRKEFNLAGLIPEDFIKLDLIYEFIEDRYIFYWDFFKMPGYNTLTEEVKAKFFPLSSIHLTEDETFWKAEGEKVLNFLFKNSRMLPCAEDLGAVPGFVRDSIFELKLLGLDIIRWTRSFEDGSYIPPEKYRSVAVSALSVHDTSSAMGWWKEASMDDKKAFYKILFPENEEELEIEDKKETTQEVTVVETTPVLTLEQKIEALEETELAELFLKTGLSAASLFSIHMLHDYIITGELSTERKGFESILKDPEKHRINVPGTDETSNWGYSYPFFAEELKKSTELSKQIQAIVRESGRGE
ncbi:MAG: 4-alpha-glucanotransferase [Leptospiraceae bacterium]|nr:4-alpha-glucanotransferase [Leptospiraceae bacterium]